MNGFAGNLITLLDILGTVAFAISGAAEAIKKRTDIFGVCLLGCTTAMGGGIFRDILLGNFPPRIFLYPLDALISLLTSLLVFFIAMKQRERFQQSEQKGSPVINLFDALGLGVFTVVGMQVAMDLGYGEYCGLAVFSGVVSAIGGGLLRDVMLREVPFVLTKRVYALASLIGGLATYFIRPLLGMNIASIIGIAIIFVIRLLASHYCWDLPKAY